MQPPSPSPRLLVAVRSFLTGWREAGLNEAVERRKDAVVCVCVCVFAHVHTCVPGLNGGCQWE